MEAHEGHLHGRAMLNFLLCFSDTIAKTHIHNTALGCRELNDNAVHM